MRIEDLSPGKLRECVEHWRIEKLDDGAGGFYRSEELQNERLRCAWEEQPPTNRITGEVLSQGSTVQMGVRRKLNIEPEDLIVHDGRVYRVVGARVKLSTRWKIVALEQRDERTVPQQQT